MNICFGVFAWNLVNYSYLFFSYLHLSIEYDNHTKTNVTVYSCSAYETTSILSWLDLFNSTLIPFTLMILFTTITLKSLFQKRRRFKFKNSSPSNNIHKRVSSKGMAHFQRLKDVKFAFTSITLNVIFLVLNIPFCIFSLTTIYVSIDINYLILFKSIIFVFYYLNFATVFYVNIIVNSMFKNEFFHLFRRKY